MWICQSTETARLERSPTKLSALTVQAASAVSVRSTGRGRVTCRAPAANSRRAASPPDMSISKRPRDMAGRVPTSGS
ncbi:hypothetical protein ACFQ60_45915 [Streptomyces zhihengii]